MGLSARQTGTNPTGDPAGVITGTLVANTAAEFAHGMGVKPTMVVATFVVSVAAPNPIDPINWDVDLSDDTQVTLISGVAGDFRAMCFF